MSRSNNLFQITREDHLLDAFSSHANQLVVVMFSAKWCGPCKKIKPQFVQLADQNPDAFFIYIDVDQYEDDKYEYHASVRAMPTFAFYVDNKELTRFEGADIDKLTRTIQLHKPSASANTPSNTCTTPQQTQQEQMVYPTMSKEAQLGVLINKQNEEQARLQQSRSGELGPDYQQMQQMEQERVEQMLRSRTGYQDSMDGAQMATQVPFQQPLSCQSCQVKQPIDYDDVQPNGS